MRSSAIYQVDDAAVPTDARSTYSMGSNTTAIKRGRRQSVDSRFNHENLGDDFERTPWLPPSIAKALQHKEEAIIRGGKKNVYFSKEIT